MCFKEVLIYNYGLYMFCVTCMIVALDVPVTFAIALLLISIKKDVCVCNDLCVSTMDYVWFV